jgi:sulfite reductase (NADPH) flavoprotein alpha-component
MIRMSQNLIPFIPENSPFSAEQRAYLNGFFAGLYSRTTVGSSGDVTVSDSKPLKPLTILFGSQTGTAEGLAKKVATEAGKRGFVPNVIDMAQYPHENLCRETRLLVLTSTYGEGDPPDNARNLWSFLKEGKAVRLESVEYSVLGLGDSNYQKFCQCAKDFDQRLENLGARRVHPRSDCDVDYEEPFQKWLEGVLLALERSTSKAEVGPSIQISVPQQTSYSRKNPFFAQLTVNRKLNAEGSAKETRHFEISLEGSNLSYEVGDALGVMPSNCPELVDEILMALQSNGAEKVAHAGGMIPFREALLRHCEINRIPKALLEAFAQKTKEAQLVALISPSANGSLDQFLYGRGIIDLLHHYPQAKFDPDEFLKLLKPLQPRLYSISSSPKAHPESVHLTVAAVRYSSLGRSRKGVCSTFLADRVNEESRVPIYVHINKAFRLPNESSVPLIMIGPGTGIAPFRAFLHERRMLDAKGKNWLFFGDQHDATDFLYRDELEVMVRDGFLTRLSTAFSRDSEHKIYVQHRMLEAADDLFRWLEEGAFFYVCGDANRMAKDVDGALHQVIERAGGLSAERAQEYVASLKNQKRYQRDVY